MDERRARLPRHGGDLAHATANYGEPPGGWVDLSTGVNPHPYPLNGFDPEALHRLPAANSLAGLVDAARRAYRVPPSVSVIPMPGSEVAIRLLPLVAQPGPVAIVSPTYRSHAEAWRSAGREVAAVGALAEVPPATAVIVLANPNNPDGRITDPSALVALADRTGLLVVDEAFADVAPQVSLAPSLRGMNAVVLRSFGKFYGLPGLRLGFVAGDRATVTRLAALAGDWPVSAPAIAIGAAALNDQAWQETMRTRLAGEMLRFRKTLTRRGLTIVGGTDLFVMVDDPRAADLHRRLAERGVWTRVFEDRPTWLRIGLPGDDADLLRLDEALSGR